MNCGIYLILNSVNGKVYVGSSKGLRRRKRAHWYHLKRGSHTNPFLQKAWARYGSHAFLFVVVEYCEGQELKDREDWWITLIGSRNGAKGHNLLPADRHEVPVSTRERLSASAKGRPHPHRGHPISTEVRKKISSAHHGRSHSPETRLKISELQKGRPKPKVAEALRGVSRPHEGVPRTPEARAKIAEANRGKVLGPEARAKISAAKKGKANSPETRAKLSSAHKGRPWSEARRLAHNRRKNQCQDHDRSDFDS